MASQRDQLAKIGLGGLALIDEYYSHGTQHKMSSSRLHPPPPQARISEAGETVINSNEAAKYYGGRIILDYGRK
ncbi:hypothetical protein SLEP1_g40130 [Rubroshorea leprosula]|uniref:Uncharacterized protein n=1 Tax=Rubroshorea leprosula TaxID=152421 RepID=A0AAV5L2N1_9ROSI|nr:hypothetical protein SLEP1_g40130 [Rubroshorea leprosula]